MIISDVNTTNITKNKTKTKKNHRKYYIIHRLSGRKVLLIGHRKVGQKLNLFDSIENIRRNAY